ncbi:MAG: hypothetical protein ACI4OY_00215, partial [Aristaeellaceae bacterium]
MQPTAVKNKNLRKRADTLQEILFVAPQLLLFVLFTIVPFFVAIPLVLTDRVSFLDNEVNYVGLKNFVTIFQEPFISEFIPALKRTIR